MSDMRARRLSLWRGLFALGVLGLACANLMPVAWGVLTSIKPVSQVLHYPPSIVGYQPTIASYRTVVEGSVAGALRISFLYAILATIIGLMVSALGAYALDRLKFPFRTVILYVVVACIPLSIGAASLIIPNYLYFSTLKMTNHWFTLPLIYIGLNLPMSTWILKGAMEAVPRELDAAAKVDGATRIGVLFRIILPLCKPGIFAAGLFYFIGSWNEFVAGSVMVVKPSLRPIQVAVYQYISVLGREWGPLTAAAMLAALPILMLVVVFGRYLVSGLTKGAVKG